MAGTGWNRRFNFFTRFFSGRINRSYVEHRNDGIYPIRNLMSAITLLISTLMLIGVSQKIYAFTGYFSIRTCAAVFDTETDIVTQSICPAPGEYIGAYLLMMPDGKKIYSYGSDTLGNPKIFVIDTGTKKIIKSISQLTIGQRFGVPIPTPDGKYLYLPLASPPNTSHYLIIDTANDSVTGDLTLPFSTANLTITKDGLHAFAQDSNTPNKINIIYLANKTIVSTISLTWQDASVPGQTEYWGFAVRQIGITPDGKQLYAAGKPYTIQGTTYYGRPDHTILVSIDTATNNIVNKGQSLNSGISNSLQSIFAFTPDGQLGFLINQSFTDFVFDTKTNTVISKFNLGLELGDAIAITPAGTYAYTANFFGAVGKYDIAANSGVGAVSYNGGFNYYSQDIVIQPDTTFSEVQKNLGDCGCTGEANPINSATGNKFQREPEAEFPVHTGLALDRYYNSLDNTKTTYGVGWRSNWHRNIQVATGGLSAQFVREDGKAVTYTKSGADWFSDADVTAKLVSVTDGFDLARENGDVEHFDTNGKLQSVTTPNGLITSVTYWPTSGLLHTVTGPYGHKIEFQYWQDTYISAVILPDGKMLSYSYDAAGNLTQAHHADTSYRTYVYENTSFPNALTGIIDESGTRFATYGYDANGKANLSTHAGNAEKTALAYNADGTTTVTDARNNVRTNSFSTVQGVLKLAAETGTPNPKAGAQSYAYDAAGFVASSTDWNNNVTAYTHDARGNETSRTEAFGTALARTITTTWHSTYNLPMTIDEPGRSTSFTRDAAGNPLTRTIRDKSTGATRTWIYTYGASGGEKGQVTSIEGPRTDATDVTTYGYDAGGGLNKITDALGHVTTLVNDANGRPTTVTDPNGLVTALTWNPRGWLDQRLEGQEKTVFSHDANGTLTKITLPGGESLSFTPDAAHRITEVKDALGNRMVYGLDALDNVLTVDVYNAAGGKVKTESRDYDNLNRLFHAYGALKQTTTFAHDGNGNTTAITDPNNHKTQRLFDALNRLDQVTDPALGVTDLTHDANDGLTGNLDPKGGNTAITRNGFGEPTAVNSPDAGLTSYTYDSAGNVLTKTDARGKVLTYTYDALNRQTKECDVANDCVVTIWDQRINGVGRVALHGYTNYVWTLNGHLAEKFPILQGNTYKLTQTWNAVTGRLFRRTYPSGMKVSYGYNAAGQIGSIWVNGKVYMKGITYRPFGPVKGWTWGVGANPAVARTFDMDGRIKRVPLSPTATHTVSYDLAGNITSLADTGLTVRSVTYDALDQVLGTHLGAAGYENYLYDANGNRTSGPLAANTLMIDPASDKLLNLKTNNVVKKTYTYDASGNLTSDGVQNFEYSTRNRLWAVWHGTNWAAHFYSGGEDVLRQYLPANNTTATLYDDAGHIVGEYAAVSIAAKAQMTWEHIYLGDIPVGAVRGAEITGGAAVTPAQVYRVYSDHLDTPRSLVKSDGATVAWSWNPKLFGNTAPSDPNGLKYNLRFPGQIYDAFSGFNINGFRLYDPATGRYTQPDPIGLAGGQNNLFTYVGGNPVLRSDTYGKNYLDDFVVKIDNIVENLTQACMRNSICDKSLSLWEKYGYFKEACENNLVCDMLSEIANESLKNGTALCDSAKSALKDRLAPLINTLGGGAPLAKPYLDQVGKIHDQIDQLRSTPPAFLKEPALPNIPNSGPIEITPPVLNPCTGLPEFICHH